MTVVLVIAFSVLAFYGMLTAWMGINVVMGNSPEPGVEPIGGFNTDSVSIIIPCRNEADRLPRLLEQLRTCNAQVIVVDDHSTDATRELALEGGATLIDNAGKGKLAALKCGLAAATGSITFTLDADVLLPDGWFTAARRALNECPADLWLFPVLTHRPRSLRERFEALDVLSLNGVTAAFSHQHHAIMGSGACMAVDTEVYRNSVDHLPTNLPAGDDTFLVQHIRRKGAVIVFLDDADLAVDVEPQPGLRSLVRQRIRWGFKAPSFRDGLAQGVALLVFLANFLMVCSLAFLISSNDWRWLIYPVVKSVFDLALLLPAIYTFRRTDLLRTLPLALAVYPLYVTVAASAAVFTHPEVISRTWR